MTREKKKFAKKTRLAPDLRQKKLQVGKGPMLEMQPKAKPSLKDQERLVKKASEFISHNVVSKDSKQESSQMLMDSGKDLPCRKSERQLKFRVL